MSEKKRVPMMLFESRPKFCGQRLHPLTAGRIVILEERENPIVMGAKKGDTVNQDDLFEMLLVVAMDDRELAEFVVDADDREWKVKAKEISMGLTPEDVGEFWELIEAEKAEIEAARASPKKKTVSRGAGAKNRKKATRRTGG
jgi:hypothetical protein